MTETSSTASAIVQAVVRRGITHAFCVPGESYLAAMDGFYGLTTYNLWPLVTRRARVSPPRRTPR